MLVIVLDLEVAMDVSVLSDEGRIVLVRVVLVWMLVDMIVLDRVVDVAVSVALGDVQVAADHEQARRSDRPHAGDAIAERERDGCTD